MTIDLTGLALDWLDAVDAPAAFNLWLDRQEPEVQAGFSALGVYAATEDERASSVRRIAAHRAAIQAFVNAGAWRTELDLGLERAFVALDQTGPHVRLYVLIGLGGSDASAVAWHGSGAAFIWLESWLGPGTTGGALQDRPITLLAPSVAHEFAHAMRYALPRSGSLLAQSNATRPAELWRERLALPLREAMYDEGLATVFSHDAFPEIPLADALGIGREAADWLEQHWHRLMSDRSRTWDFDRRDPPVDWMRDALFYDRSRVHPPWTLERPPTKWGYYVGLQWGQASRGDWITRLASRAAGAPRLGERA